MKSTKSILEYFKEEDVLYFSFKGGKEKYSVEIIPGITAELNDEGEVIGLEILDASKFILDTVFDSVQAKILMAKDGVKMKRIDKKKEVVGHGKTD